MATRKVKRLAGGFDKGEFEGVDEAVYKNADSGEWARGENYGDGTTGDERVAMAKAPAREASASEMRAASKPSGSAIVTKEQLAKSGFTNLRDYLNDKQGLKRRDGAAPSRVASAAKEVATEIKSKEADVKEAPRKDILSEAKDIARSRYAGARAVAEANRPKREAPGKFAGKGPGFGALKYKSGGSTSSRGDGIAQRGKTRGTMVAMCGGGRTKK